VSVPQHKHRLFIFGGVDEDTKLELESAFEIRFSRERCLDSCKKNGGAPLTCKCLGDPQVRKSIDMDKEYALLVNAVQEANEYAIYALTKGGYDESILQSLVLIRPVEHRNDGDHGKDVKGTS